MKKSNLIFDLDGTLTDSGPGIKNSVRHTLLHYGLPMEEDAMLNRYVGPPLMVSFQQFMGFTPNQAVEAIGIYREYFTQKGMFENQVYSGIEALLCACKKQGYELFIATGKPTVYAVQILNHFGLSQYFNQVCGIGLDETAMSKAELIEQVLRDNGLNANDCVMIGDRQYDIFGANQTGVEAIGVTYGYGTVEELTAAGAKLLAHSVEQLQQILCEQ